MDSSFEFLPCLQDGLGLWSSNHRKGIGSSHAHFVHLPPTEQALSFQKFLEDRDGFIGANHPDGIEEGFDLCWVLLGKLL